MEKKPPDTPDDAHRPAGAENIKRDLPERDAYEAAVQRAVAHDIAIIIEHLREKDDCERER